MNWSSAFQALGAILAAAISLVGIGGRDHRRRLQIKANLELLEQLRGQDWFAASFHAQTVIWLESRVGLDVARLAGVPTINAKKPIPWSGVSMATVLSIIFAVWGALLSRQTYNWWSLPLWVFAGLMLISVIGQFTDRDIPQTQVDEQIHDPLNVPLRTLQQMRHVISLKEDLAENERLSSSAATLAASSPEAILAEVQTRYAEFATNLRSTIEANIKGAPEPASQILSAYLTWPEAPDVPRLLAELRAVEEGAGVSAVLSLMVNASGDVINFLTDGSQEAAAVYADSDDALIRQGLVFVVDQVDGQTEDGETMKVSMTEKGREVARLLTARWPPPAELDTALIEELAELRLERRA